MSYFRRLYYHFKLGSFEVPPNNMLTKERYNPKVQELPLPSGASESDLHEFLRSMPVVCPPFSQDALIDYCDQHIRRFIYTYGLIKELKGKALELGAAPYFFTILIDQFADFDLVLANYYGQSYKEDYVYQDLSYLDFYTKEMRSLKLDYHHFDIERDFFPFDDDEFDLVIFCEIIEHLTMDPIFVLREIKRVLKQDGKLILTTPNVNRYDNIHKIIVGGNIYDPYSGFHGPYGRHNREYSALELYLLLDYCGFTVDSIFTADVQNKDNKTNIDLYEREGFNDYHSRGQYIFIRALNSGEATGKKPTFLYRSYPQDELDKMEIYFPEQDDIIEDPIIAFCKCWYGLEKWDGVPTRWMGKNGALFVYSMENNYCDLSIRSMSFIHPRYLEITKDRAPVARFLVPTTLSDMKTPIKLREGINLIEFNLPEGCEKPSDSNPDSVADDRCLGLAFQEIKISNI